MERTFVGPPADSDKYEIVELKSRGGEGEVWRGFMHVDGTHMPVAVKVIHAHNLDDFASWRQRWHRQAEVLRSLDHPALVKVREMFAGPPPHAWRAADTSTETLYLVMNWVEGPTASEWVARNPNRDPLESIRVISALAGAVDYLHHQALPGQPVLHRDIKPSNVIVTPESVKLLDFGFVRVVRPDQSMTMVGSPSYIAPEVVAGYGYSEASDLYAFGATSYFLLTGEAVSTDNPAAMRAKLATLRGFANKPVLIDHVLSMIDADHARRPKSAIEWAQGLAVLSVSDGATTTVLRPPVPRPPTPIELAGPPERRRGRRLPIMIAAAVIAVIAVAGGALALSRGGSSGTTELAASGVGAKKDSSTSTTSSSTSTSSTSSTTSTSTTTSTTTLPPGPTAPVVVGKTLDEAASALRNLGASVTVQKIYDPTKNAGTVISQVPAAGQALGTSATINVATGPASVYLDQVDTVSNGGFALGQTVGVNGQTLTHSSTAGTNFGYSNVSVEYNLARSFDRFDATVGYLDTAARDGKVRVEITLDNVKIYSKDFELGVTDKIDLPVTGGLRMVVTAIALVDSKITYADGTAVLGEARLLGDPALVEKFTLKKN